MATSDLFKALMKESNYGFSPSESMMGITSAGVAQALPSLVNPYGSTSGNIARVLGGALLAGLMGYSAKKEAEEKNALLLPQLLEISQAQSPEQIQTLLGESEYKSKLLPVALQRMSSLESQKERLAKALQQENLYRNRFLWSENIKNQNSLAQTYNYASAQDMAESNPDLYNALFGGEPTMGTGVSMPAQTMTPSAPPVPTVATEALETTYAAPNLVQALEGGEEPAGQSVLSTIAEEPTAAVAPVVEPAPAPTLTPAAQKMPQEEPVGEFDVFADVPLATQLANIKKTNDYGRPLPTKEIENRRTTVSNLFKTQSDQVKEAKERVRDLAKTWNETNQNYLKAQQLSKGKEAAYNDALMYVVRKAFDPTSTVTIPEFELTGDIQDVYNELKGLAERQLFGYGNLSPKAKANLVDTVKIIRKYAGRAYNDAVDKEAQYLKANRVVKNATAVYPYPRFITSDNALKIKTLMERSEMSKDPIFKKMVRDSIAQEVGNDNWTGDIISRYMEE